MTEHGHLILINGDYQIVALTPEEEFDADSVLAYGIWTLSGTRIRRELSLDGARAWLKKLIAEEQKIEQCLPPAVTASRLRR